MARQLMPKSGIMMPYVVLNRHAGITGVTDVDGDTGSIILSSTYLKIVDADARFALSGASYSKADSDNKYLAKASPVVTNNVAFKSKSPTGALPDIDLIKATDTKSVEVGSLGTGSTGVVINSEGGILEQYTDAGGSTATGQVYSKRYRPLPADMPFAVIGDYVYQDSDPTKPVIGVNKSSGINSDIKALNGLTKAITIAQGGTGVTTAASAIIVLGGVPIKGVVTTAIDLNDYGPVDAYVGLWQFSATTSYTSANLPEATSGLLEVFRGGDYGGMQRYTAATTGFVWIRTLTATWNATTKPWGVWKPVGSQATKAYAVDLNLLTVGNIYSCSAATTNTPPGITIGGWCFHYSHSASGNYLQIYTTATNNVSQMNRSFQRTYNGTAWSDWAEIYTANSKPSPADLGVLPVSGGTLTGETIVANGVHLMTMTGTGAAVPNAKADVFYSGTDSLSIGSASQQTLFRSSVNPTLRVGTGAAQTLYHTGNKPTAADVGAYPISGGTLSGALTTTGNVTGGGLVSTGALSVTTGATIGGAVTGRDFHSQPGGGIGVAASTQPNSIEMNNLPNVPTNVTFVNTFKGSWYNSAFLMGWVRDLSKDGHFQLSVKLDSGPAADFNFNADGTFTSPLGSAQWGGSDRKLKDDIRDADGGSLDRIGKIIPREFDWKYDGRHDRGYVAQELQEVDSVYVFEDDKGTLNVSQNALISDLIGSVQTLTQKVKDLEAKLEEK